MKGAVCLLFALTLGMSSAQAGFDYRDFCQFPLVSDGQSVTVRVATIRNSTFGVDVEKMWFWNWIELASGIDFEVEQIPGSDLDTRKRLMFAADDLPDLLYGLSLTTGELMRYGQMEGMLMPLNPYFTKSVMPNACAWFEAYPETLAYSTAPDGNAYTLPWMYDLENLVGESARIFYNADWLDEASMPFPDTLDGFVEMLYKIKALHPECTPLGGGINAHNPMHYLLNAYGFLCCAGGYGNDVAIREGAAVIPAGDPLFKEILRLMRRFFEDNIISPDFFTLDGKQLNARMNAGQIGVYPYVPFLVNSDPGFWSRWESVTPLVSGHNPEKKWLAPQTISIGAWAVSAQSAHGELLARFADFFFSDIGTIYSWYGPMNGNGDDLGMTEGWRINPETNSREWPEITSGKYASTDVYLQQVGCAVGGGGIGNHSHTIGTSYIPAGYDRDNIMRYLYGAPIEQNVIYDMTAPDAAFRYSMLKNISPYETPGFPYIVYYGEDATNAMYDLKMVLETYMKKEITKFIVGERHIEEFDLFVGALERMGLRQYEAYYQRAYADHLKNTR